MYDSSMESLDLEEELEKIQGVKRKMNSRTIIQNLFNRELTGKVLNRNNPFGDRSSVPERLRIPIMHVIPRWAMEAGNIFMGFTECGRYLLSYTVRSTESDFGRFLWREREDLTFEYKLHFWLFTPNTHVRKVCSVTLFDNYGICHDNLLIEISQWKDNMDRLLVTGRSVNPALPHNSQQFVTITTIPDAKHCPNCFYGPPDEVYDDHFAEVRRTLTTCIRHGLTVHLAHDQVQPFPRFNPDIMLRFKDSVVLNTGNLFHIFTVKLLEPKETSSFRQELITLPPGTHSNIFNGVGIGRYSGAGKKRHRHLRCDFWFKNCRYTSPALMQPREAGRLFDTSNEALTEEAENENNRKVHAQELIAALLPDIWALRYPPMAFIPTPRKRRYSQSSLDSEVSSTTSDKSSSSVISRERMSPAPDPCKFLLKTRMDAAVAASKMLPPDGRKFFKRLWRSPTLTPGSLLPKPSAPVPVSSSNAATLTAYDIFEETMIDRNFSSFRKRRLADKRYEFKDADLELSENIVPLKLSRKSSSTRVFGVRGQSPVTISSSLSNENGDNAHGYPRSPRGWSHAISPASISPAQGEILRAITNTNTCPPLMSPTIPLPTEVCSVTADVHSRKSSGAGLGAFRQSGSSGKNSHPNFSTNFNCIAKVLRCYAEEDDGALSVKTDTDDEYRQTLPFPVALQLKVHGTAYRPVSVISNSKSRTCPTPVVEVLQRSLDIEILCNEVSSIMCLAAEKYYCSCFDYDVAIVDVCQERGSISAVAFVLMTAMSLRRNQHEKYNVPNSRTSRDLSPVPGLTDQKQKYEAIFSFIWEPIEERCRVLYMGNLKELFNVPKQWHPTKRLVSSIRSRLYDDPFDTKANKTLRNDLAVKDWKSLDELTDSQGIITLYRERKPNRRRNIGFYPSPAMSSESSQGGGGSVTTSDDDEGTEDENRTDSWN